MNILFIVTELNSANGICARAVMKEMISKGHSVYFVTNLEKHADLDDTIHYYFVRHRLVYRLLNDPNSSKLKRNIGLILNKIKLTVSYPTWPLISPLYTRRIYRTAKKICTDNDINMIIPIYSQIDTLLAANRIKKEMPSIEYIPYFLDSLSGGYGPKCFSKKWTIRRGIKWEEKLLPLADKIVMMESSRVHHEKYSLDKPYFSKMIFSDLPLISQPKKPEYPKSSSDIVDLLFIGSIPIHVRNPEPFLKAFCQTKNNRYRLTIVGTNTCAELLSKYSAKDSRIVLHAPVSHEEAMEYIAKADILVNFGNNNSSMTPSKIFEYMSYGKSIISTMPITDEPSAAYLQSYPLAYLLKYENINYEAEAENMEKWINNTVGKNIDFDTVKALFPKNTPEHFCDIVFERSDSYQDS